MHFYVTLALIPSEDIHTSTSQKISEFNEMSNRVIQTNAIRSRIFLNRFTLYREFNQITRLLILL
jgi:hypothetical protein